MFDIGWQEMLVIAIVLIVVVGPKDLPAMLRSFGRTTTKLKAMAGDFRKQFDEALKEAELDDVKGMVDDVRKLNPAGDLRKALSPMEKAAQDVRAGIDEAMRPTAKPQAQVDAAKGSASTAVDATPAPPLENDGGKPAKPAPATPAAKKPAATKPKAARPAKSAAAARKGGAAR